MKLSYFMQPVHPTGKDYRRCLEEDLEAVVLADKLGYTEAFLGEHFTDLAEPIRSTLGCTTKLRKSMMRMGS